jgi:hypothetical protein
MDDHADLRRVCVEPALYAFAPARTIAATLSEYEAHLGRTAGLAGHAVRETLDALSDLLDPVEAPLVALTAGMARALVTSLARETLQRPGGALQASRRGIEAAWRFFCWAKDCGYVGNNPFESLWLGSPTDAVGTAYRERSVGVAARGWVA